MPKTYLLLLICLIAPSPLGHGQSTPSDTQQLVVEAYDLKNVLVYSTTEKRLNRGGDGIAVALAHIIGQSTISDPQIERVCTLLESVFRWPKIIENPADHNPDISLLLLNSEGLHTNNPALQNRISVLRLRLMGLYKKSD